MKKLFFIFLLFTGLYLCGEKVLILDNLNAPRMLSVYDDRAYEKIRHDPETRASGGTPKQFEFTSSAYFPQIREITADDQNVYLLTFNQKLNKTEFVIWNMACRKAVNVYLPSPPVGLFDDELTGRINRYYYFHRGFYYYLRDNEEEEIWELSRIEFLKKN